mgnify:CR=1 FL=1
MLANPVNPVNPVTAGPNDRVRGAGKKVSQGVPPVGGTTDLLLPAARGRAHATLDRSRSADRVTEGLRS